MFETGTDEFVEVVQGIPTKRTISLMQWVNLPKIDQAMKLLNFARTLTPSAFSSDASADPVTVRVVTIAEAEVARYEDRSIIVQPGQEEKVTVKVPVKLPAGLEGTAREMRGAGSTVIVEFDGIEPKLEIDALYLIDASPAWKEAEEEARVLFPPPTPPPVLLAAE
jgi:hypothetical protein